MKIRGRTYFSILLVFSVLFATPVVTFGGWLDKLNDLVNTGGSDSSVSDSDIAGALKDALQIGSGTVVQQLSAPGGFSADPAVHIPLPDSLHNVQKYMNKFGMGASLNDLENKLNEAAEVATVKAKPLFIDAIRQLSWDDARNILNGPNDAATQYFKSKMSNPLAKEMRPIVDQSLAQVGAIKTFNKVMSDYKSLPLVPDVQADLTDHVLDKGIEGIFFYMGKEEAKIRNDPAKQTTELLKKVFSK